MTKLFAAPGPDGAMRFIGEVARGTACGCFCPECGSALVAKKGVEKEWHFAHVSGQERPECEAGAVNMLRRLAMEYLHKQQPLQLPVYKTVVTLKSPLRVLSEEVTWRVQPIGRVEWMVHAARGSPVGKVSTEGGGTLEIFIGIGSHATRGYSATSGVEAAVLYSSPLPEANTLRTRVDAERYLSTHGRLSWLYHAPRDDVAHAATARLREQAKADEERYERARRQRAQESPNAWPVPGGGRQEGGIASRPSGDDAHPARGALGQRRSDIPALQFDWAPKSKSGTGFTLYRLRDGSAWVIYAFEDEGYAIASWPGAEDGWDEALPPSIATADKSLGVYRIHDLVQAVMFLTARADIVRSTSNPREFDEIA